MLKQFLSYFGFLDQRDRVSLTNITVMVFVAITAFRSLFGNLTLTLVSIQWTVQPIDFASTLPLLFALLNYTNKRMEINKTSKKEE